MICPKCGKEILDNSEFCTECGEKINKDSADDTVKSIADGANKIFDQAESQLGETINDVAQSLNGGDSNWNNSGGPLPTNRSLVMYIILTVVTCGIYGFWFVYRMAHDVNIACEGDNEHTAGLVKYIILSIITCGIYSIYWEYALGNRLATNAVKYDMIFQENGTTVLLWHIFGTFLCGLGPFIAMNILINNTNKICNSYNRQHGF